MAFIEQIFVVLACVAAIGFLISGLDDLPEGVQAFHAGTTRTGGHVVTSGGRVLTLVGADRAAVYDAVRQVDFSGKVYRTDIGLEVAVPAG